MLSSHYSAYESWKQPVFSPEKFFPDTRFMSNTLPPSEEKRLATSSRPWMTGESRPKSTRRNSKSHSDGAESTNESRQPIRESFLLVRLECCQQALMSFR